MEFLDPALERYIDAHTQPGHDLLARLEKETHQKVLKPRMLSGHLQGRVLSALAHMLKPKRVLEIGTYTGYSALCLAEGMPAGGTLVTIDRNDEIAELAQRYFKEAAQYLPQVSIDFRLGPALDIIPTLEGPFDLVFIDADKPNYLNYYHVCLPMVAPGGFIVADNVLWGGKVLGGQPDKKKKSTDAIVAFNKAVHNDPRVENVLFPVRDGLMVMRKK